MNAATYLVDRQVEMGRADHIAIGGRDGSLTYADLQEHIRAASTGWRAFGLRPEERVIIYAGNRPRTVVALLSVMRCGAVAVPLSPMHAGADLARLLRESRARFLVVDAQSIAQTHDALGDSSDDLSAVVCLDDLEPQPRSGINFLFWERDLLACGANNSEPDRTSKESPAIWLYTSGTTGLPKAAMHRHGSIATVSEAYAQGTLGINAHDRCFSASKLAFAYGLGNALFPLSVGATLLLDSAASRPENLLRVLLEDRPTVFFAVPSIYAALLRDEKVSDTGFASVRFAVSAGEALHAKLHKQFEERFGVELVNGLGSTEALHIYLSNRPGYSRPGSIGHPVPGYQVRILSDDGCLAPVGSPGILQVQAPSSAIGYWRRTAATKDVFEGHWLNTGDIAIRDEQGDFIYRGRSTDMIKSGALWVSPVEIEARLLEHPAVAEAAVVAVADEHGLDKPVACVVINEMFEITAQELIAFCAQKLPSFKRPCHIMFFDCLPVNNTGKVQRRAVREVATAQLRSDLTSEV